MKREIEIGPLIFRELDLEKDKEICLKFRGDSFFTSFGTEDAFWEDDGKGGERYIEWLKEKDPTKFGAFHIWNGDEIVGQMELALLRSDESWGYVNLFYLKPEARGKGLSKHLDDFATQFLKGLGVARAKLSVSPSNKRAWNYYLKCGWQDRGPRDFEGRVGKGRENLVHWMSKEL